MFFIASDAKNYSNSNVYFLSTTYSVLVYDCNALIYAGRCNTIM